MVLGFGFFYLGFGRLKGEVLALLFLLKTGFSKSLWNLDCTIIGIFS